MNVQLDQHQAELFYRMQKGAGLSVTDTLKMLIYPALQRFEEHIEKADYRAACEILGIRVEENTEAIDATFINKILPPEHIARV